MPVSSMIPNYKVRSAARDLYSNMQLAKMEAIKTDLKERDLPEQMQMLLAAQMMREETGKTLEDMNGDYDKVKTELAELGIDMEIGEIKDAEKRISEKAAVEAEEQRGKQEEKAGAYKGVIYDGEKFPSTDAQGNELSDKPRLLAEASQEALDLLDAMVREHPEAAGPLRATD